MSFTCPHCGAVSHNLRDAQERYCARCHKFLDDPQSIEEWLAVLHLEAELAPLTPEDRRRVLDVVRERLKRQSE